MKGIKAIAQQKTMPEYEKQRLQLLKKNADFMHSQGYGTLANKILQDRANRWNAEAEDKYADEPAEFAQESEGETSAKVSKQSKSRCMADFVKQHQQPQPGNQQLVEKQRQEKPQQQPIQLQKQPIQLEKQKSESVTSAKPIGDTIVEAHQPVQPQKQQKSRPLLLQQQSPQIHQLEPGKKQHVQKQCHGKQSQQSSHLWKQQQPTQLQKQQQPIQMQRQQAVQNPNVQKENQVQLQYCPPGSLSKFVHLRKKQAVGTDDPCNTNQEIEVPLTSPNANEVQLERNAENELHSHVEVEAEMAVTVAPEKESQPTIGSSTTEGRKTKKHRGPSKLTHIHARKKEQRTPIILNSYGQPIGPTKKDVDEFSRFLGTVARNTDLAPLNYLDWRDLPTHDEIWDYVLEKFMVPIEGRRWVMLTLDYIWRSFKSRLKSKYFRALETNNSELMDEVREAVPENVLADLINYWGCSPVKDQSKVNKRNRSMLDDMHTMGPTSYAWKRHKLQQEDPNKQEPSKAKLYREARRRNPNKKYKTSFENTKARIERMEALESQQHEEGNNCKDPYHEVITKSEHSGRVRLYGKGVTKSKLNDGANKAAYIFPQEFLQSIQRQVEEKLQEANPGKDLVIPEFFEGVTSSVPRNGASQAVESNDGQVNVGTNSANQVQHQETRLEVEDF